jgi:hypothetical protein
MHPILATLFLMAMSIIPTILSVGSNKSLMLGLSASPQSSLFLVLLRVNTILLFLFTLPSGHTLILSYVDDMLIMRDDSEYIAFVKVHLSDQLHMSDLSPLSYFLEVTSTPDGYYLSKRKCIHDLLDHASLTDHRSMNTPM